MDTVLLVEDEKFLRHRIRQKLEEENFTVFEASHGKRSLAILDQYSVDLVLLDLVLPDGNGLDFIGDMRQCTAAPILIVSSDLSKESKITGLERGADDYISKPFEPDELVARIRANIRRSAQQTANRTDSTDTAALVCGQLHLDRASYRVKNGHTVCTDLTVQEFHLLDYLAAHSDRVLHRDELCEALRDGNYVPTPRTIDVRITRIRKKIGDNATSPHIIKTVRGVGYLFESSE